MFFRFISAIALVVLVSMAGVVVEKRMLDLRRDVSRQQYRTEILLDRYTALRLKTQQLSSPDRMLETMREQQMAPRPLSPREPLSESMTETRREGLPLMRWEQPVRSVRPIRPFRWRRKDVR